MAVDLRSQELLESVTIHDLLSAELPPVAARTRDDDAWQPH